MISHRKVHSQGSIPFSWEEIPGVSELCYQECHKTLGTLSLKLSPLLTSPLPLSPSLANPYRSEGFEVSASELKIRPPPCPFQGTHRRSSTKDVIRLKEDPFLVAYKECTKSEVNGKLLGQSKKALGSGLKRTKLLFSCKNSCEVKEGFLKLFRFPPLRRDRIRVLVGRK